MARSDILHDPATRDRLLRIRNLLLRQAWTEDAAFLERLAGAVYHESICGARIHISGGVFDTCGRPRGHEGACGG